MVGGAFLRLLSSFSGFDFSCKLALSDRIEAFEDKGGQR